MKIPVSSLTLILFISSFSINEAAILTVDNNAGNQPDFTSLQEAHDAAESGDTIHLAPSSQVYNVDAIEKSLTIIGPGFGTGTFAMLGEITISASDVMIMGVTFRDTLRLRGVVQGVGFYRNHFRPNSRIRIANEFNVSVSASNVFFVNNYIESGLSIGDKDYSHSINNFYLLNNIILAGEHSFETGSGTIAHNFFYKKSGGDNTYIRFISRGWTGVLRNNIIAGEGFADFFSIWDNTPIEDFWQIENNLGLEGFNISHEGLVTVGSITDAVTMEDDYGRIAMPVENSPALGAGTNGSDIGPFGGPHPWNLDQRPPLPYISRLVAPTIIGVGETLEVTLEAKPNN